MMTNASNDINKREDVSVTTLQSCSKYGFCNVHQWQSRIVAMVGNVHQWHSSIVTMVGNVHQRHSRIVTMVGHGACLAAHLQRTI